MFDIFRRKHSRSGQMHEASAASVLELEAANRLLTARVEALSAELANKDKYQLLPANDYAQFAMPLEYPPSRSLKPRWGYTHPTITMLDSWFEEERAKYADLLDDMLTESRSMTDVLIDYDETKLPIPAWFGGPYAPIDSVLLSTMIKRFKPARYLEIGSGITTCFAYRAIREANLETRIISVDPEPRSQIDGICQTVVRTGLEIGNLDIFDELEAGDILFFDGSHRCFMNSDVTVFFIDILPRLKPGVIIHIHDIYLPWDYHDFFINWYWSEQYLLAVYLMNAKRELEMLMPSFWVCQRLRDHRFFSEEKIDFGSRNDAWLGGGAIWFRKRET